MKRRFFYLCMAMVLFSANMVSVHASNVSSGDALMIGDIAEGIVAGVSTDDVLMIGDTGEGIVSHVSAGDALTMGNATKSIDSTLQVEPNIEVTVPSSGQIIINPYHMKVNMAEHVSTDQIVSVEQFLVNHSNVPIQINASAYGKPKEESELCFAENMDDLNSGSKAAYIYMEFQHSPDGTSVSSWSESYQDADNQLLITSRENAKTGVLTLAAGDQSPTYGAYRFFGAAAVSPDQPWTVKDDFDLTVVFHFVPLTGAGE